ncbi:MAG: hypothetical protein L7F78_13310 [Syntrophales bacterium LBB04]|nr:hypothetical protein [Syntrophales bacterium LBB04]
MAIVKNGIPLSTLADWEKYAGPKRSDQWADGRSAKEAARAWISNGENKLPEEVLSVLVNHEAFGPIQSWQAEPEAKLSFDSFRGETRNADIIVCAQDSHGPFLIAVEAKADEPFGETVANTLAAAVERHLRTTAQMV